MRVNFKKLLCILMTGLLLQACSSRVEYMVYRDVPEQPSFTVVPVSYTTADAGLKSEVESSLIRMGLSVIEPALVKQVIVPEITNAQRARREGQLNESSKTVVEPVETSLVYDHSKADYVILVNADLKVLKMTRSRTGEIQSIIKYTVLDKSGERFIKLYDVLKNLGFKLKSVTEEEKIKMLYPLKEQGLMRH